MIEKLNIGAKNNDNNEDLLYNAKVKTYMRLINTPSAVVCVIKGEEIIWADQLMALFLPEIVEKGDEILFDVKCSQALEEMILKYGGKPIMWKTGHSLIKQRMAELNCKFGGECHQLY